MVVKFGRFAQERGDVKKFIREYISVGLNERACRIIQAARPRLGSDTDSELVRDLIIEADELRQEVERLRRQLQQLERLRRRRPRTQKS